MKRGPKHRLKPQFTSDIKALTHPSTSLC